MDNMIRKEENKPILIPDDIWSGKNKKMKCKTCQFFVLKLDDTEITSNLLNTDNHIGRCRRHAPTLIGYPVVFREDWCGDHKLK